MRDWDEAITPGIQTNSNGTLVTYSDSTGWKDDNHTIAPVFCTWAPLHKSSPLLEEKQGVKTNFFVSGTNFCTLKSDTGALPASRGITCV